MNIPFSNLPLPRVVSISQTASKFAQDLFEMEEMRDPSAIAATAWVAYNGLRAMLQNGSSVSVSGLPPASEGLLFANHPPVRLQLLRQIFGDEHVVYNLWGLYETFRSIGIAQGEYARIVGFEKYFEEHLHIVKNGTSRLEPDHKFVKSIRLIYAEWVLRYARSHGLDVRFEGIDQIPQKGHVVYALAPHVAIYPDFWFTYADPRLVPVADAFNFRDNLGSKISGVALVVDKTALPLVDRDRPGNKTRFKHLLDASVTYGIRPAWFINGSRVEESYLDDGTPDRPGFYSSMPDKEDLGQFVQPGGVVTNAIGLAKRTVGPVTIVIVTLRGTECMAKRSRGFPFIQPNRSGGKIVYRIVDARTVYHSHDKHRKEEIGGWITNRVRDDLKIDDYLCDVVDQWGKDCRYGEDTRRLFQEKATSDVRYYVIADRIRSIHPRFPERFQSIQRLLKFIHPSPSPEDHEIKRFVMDVSQILKKKSATQSSIRR